MSIVRSVLAVLGGIARPQHRAVRHGAGHWSEERRHRHPVSGVARMVTFSMIAGGFVTAWIAPRARVAHAVGMGALQAAMTIVAMLMPPEGASQPLWVWLGGIALMVPAAWAGARLRSSRQRA